MWYLIVSIPDLCALTYLENFWNAESIGVIDKQITSGDVKAKEIFNDAQED